MEAIDLPIRASDSQISTGVHPQTEWECNQRSLLGGGGRVHVLADLQKHRVGWFLEPAWHSAIIMLYGADERSRMGFSNGCRRKPV
jgi:hypothetical protein